MLFSCLGAGIISISKKKFSYFFYIHISQLWRLDLNSTFWLILSSRSITEQLTVQTIFTFYSRILRRGFYRLLRFLIKISLPCITIPPNMAAFIHPLFFVIMLPLRIQIFFSQVSCVFFDWHTLFVPFLLAIQKHASHYFVASFSCHPKLWQHSPSHNFYLARRFAASVSIQQLIW